MATKLPYIAYSLLFDAAAQFRYYEAQHNAKGTYESGLKAKVNNQFATRIEDYLKECDGTA